MIINILIGILIFILDMIRGILSAIEYVIPTQFIDAIAYGVDGVKYFRGVLPVPEIFAALTTFIGFLVLFYTMKIVLKLWAMLPFIGRKLEVNTANKLDLRESPEGVLDLRKTRGNHIIRNTRDIK